MASPEGDSNELLASCICGAFLNRKGTGTLQTAKYLAEAWVWVLIITLGLLFPEALAGYSPCICSVFLHLPLQEKRWLHYHWLSSCRLPLPPANSLGLLEIRFWHLKIFPFQECEETNCPGANIPLLIVWTASLDNLHLKKLAWARAATEMCLLLIDF